ncbi:TonB-dependent receptor domain-containing protein [Brevundimonas fluminis]|jgi:outer membrane receptor protein involved in Fe transport|uniref:TonB-dependent receptor domain-containing protein n=1 Tax=Brevundimonas fluminis TaxID=2487274 RepID=UPI0013DDC359|nr:TonB-dependent receptor [Brevundimonas fluminis]
MRSRTLLATTALALLLALPAGAVLAQDRPQPRTEEEAERAEEDTQVEEVVVQGLRPDILTQADRMSYNVGNDLQAQSGSVADVLRNVPGVEVDLQGNVSLRGDGNVTILIDGRPSAMFSGGSRADALQAMSGGTLERVEVITNPSAAFSPEGSGGIINLVTKKTTEATQSGTLRLGYGGDDRYNVSISGSRRDGALTLAGDVGYRVQANEQESSRTRFRPGPTPADERIEQNEGLNEGRFEAMNARISADYDLNERDRVSGELGWREFSVDGVGQELFTRENGTGVLLDAYVRDGAAEFTNEGLNGRTSFRRKFGEQHELVVDLEYGTNENERLTEATTDVTAGGGSDSVERIGGSTTSDEWGVKVDYTRPMGERRTLKVGYELDVEDNEFDNFGFRGPDFASLAPVAGLNSLFRYDETIHAAYGTYDRPFGDLDVQFGLRLEQVEFELDQVTQNVQVERDYFRAYPTLNFGYQLTESQRLRGGYSRRIARPSPQDLNPFTVYIDPQNLRRGNPDLEPEITDSYELGWQMRAGRTFYSATAFYRDSSGGVTDVVQDLGGGVVLTTRENLGESQRMGVEFIANGQLPFGISYNASGTVFRNDIFVPGVAGADRSGTSASVRASINWQPTPDDFFQINGFYNGEQLQAQGYREAFGILNLGYRRKLTDDLSLTLTGVNILDTAEQKIVVDTPAFSDRVTARFQEPAFFVGLTWNFGGGPRRQEPAFDFNTGAGGPG